MATPTTYTNLTTWFSNTYPRLDWKGLSSNSKEKYRIEYQSWVTSLSAPAATTTASATPSTSQLEGMATTETAYTSLAGIENPTPAQLETAGFGPKPKPTTAPPAGHPAYSDPNTPWYKPTTPTIPTTSAPTTSSLEQLTAQATAGIPELPAYKPTAELEKLSSQVGGAISGIIEQGGLGMGEETKQQIFLREAEIINANTAQANKNLEDKMAAQGLSDSGMAFSEGMKLASKSTIAMANIMRDVEIQDALMKVASYENALGLGVQFLSYLSEESWRQYQPTLYQWQAKVDTYKMAINQAYTQNNMAIQQAYTQGNMALAQYYEQQNAAQANKWAMELAQFEADTNIQLTQMTIDAAADAASKKTFWDILGTGLGIIAGLFF